jgi:hypothetical protein
MSTIHVPMMDVAIIDAICGRLIAQAGTSDVQAFAEPMEQFACRMHKAALGINGRSLSS